MALKPTSSQWVSLIAFLTVQFLAAFYLQGMAILAPAFALTYHLNALQVSTLISVKAFGTVLGGLVLGASLDRINGRYLSWIGLLSALLLFAFTEGWIASYPVLLFSMLVLGMVLPVFSILGLYAITHDYPANQIGKLLGIRQSVIPLGGIVAGAAFPLLFTLGLFSLLGGMSVLICGMTLLLVFAVWKMPRLPVADTLDHAAYQTSLRILWPVGLVVFLMGAGQFSVLVFGLFYLRTLAIHMPWVGSAVFALFLAGGFVARIAAGYLVDGSSPLKTVLATIALIGALTMVVWGSISDHPAVWSILGFSFVFGAGIVGYNALPLQWAAALVGRNQKGRAMGIVSAISGLAVTIWLPVFGVIVEAWGYRVMWYVVALLYLAAFILVLRYVHIQDHSLTVGAE